MDHINDTTKHVIDFASALAALGAVTALLPPLAALLSIIWTSFRLVEMVTGKTISELLKGK